ncbi:hypothetical protein LguiA_014219 [Lonicera macranthoides]
MADFIDHIPHFAPYTPLHTLAFFMDHFTNRGQNLEIPASTEQGSSMGNIPVLPEVRRYQIPDSVRIRVPGPEEGACYYRLGEIYFYEAAFEHGLRFPMDDHMRKPLVNMDLTPA